MIIGDKDPYHSDTPICACPGPDLADQDDVMEKEVWEASKNNGISKSTRARAGGNCQSLNPQS
jgi:hypothetical protein